jgi:hypothetical protein
VAKPHGARRLTVRASKDRELTEEFTVLGVDASSMAKAMKIPIPNLALKNKSTFIRQFYAAGQRLALGRLGIKRQILTPTECNRFGGSRLCAKTPVGPLMHAARLSGKWRKRVSAAPEP